MHETEAGVFERVHAGDAEGEAYHGPALRVLLRDVSASAACARPLPGAHTIWEILLHLVAWHEWAVGKLDGGDPRVEADGWVVVPDTSEAAWNAARVRLDSSHGRLVARIRALPDERSARVEAALRFILHHDVYHAGQIGLLRRAGAAATD